MIAYTVPKTMPSGPLLLIDRDEDLQIASEVVFEGGPGSKDV